MKISVAHDFLPKHNSVRASQVMDHFGINFEQGRHVVAEGLELPIEPGQVVLFTGASGSGKSSIMRAVCDELRRPEPSGTASTRSSGETAATNSDAPHVISLDDLILPGSLLIDSLDLPAAEAMNLLSTCGLGEAHLMLRTPAELSDGQRYRFRLALALAQRPQWVLADEFTATLDRTLAKVVAYNIRRLAHRTGTGFLLATTHEDVAADLDPDVHIRCRLDGEVQVLTQDVENTASATTASATRGQGEEGTRSVHGTDEPVVAAASPVPPVTLSPGPSATLSTDTALRPGRKKKTHLLRHRPLALRSDPPRLAVLRSVALPQPSPRPHPQTDSLVARR